MFYGRLKMMREGIGRNVTHNADRRCTLTAVRAGECGEEMSEKQPSATSISNTEAYGQQPGTKAR